MWWMALPPFGGRVLPLREPPPRHGADGRRFTRESFTCIEAKNAWRCPSEHKPHLAAFEHSRGTRRYLAQAADCRACASRPGARPAKLTEVNVSIYEPARRAAQALAGTTIYVQSQRRRLKVEILLAHLKQQFRTRRLRLLGLQGAAEEFHLTAIVQNLRRLGSGDARSPWRQLPEVVAK